MRSPRSLAIFSSILFALSSQASKPKQPSFEGGLHSVNVFSSGTEAGFLIFLESIDKEEMQSDLLLKKIPSLPGKKDGPRGPAIKEAPSSMLTADFARKIGYPKETWISLLISGRQKILEYPLLSHKNIIFEDNTMEAPEGTRPFEYVNVYFFIPFQGLTELSKMNETRAIAFIGPKEKTPFKDGRFSIVRFEKTFSPSPSLLTAFENLRKEQEILLLSKLPTPKPTPIIEFKSLNINAQEKLELIFGVSSSLRDNAKHLNIFGLGIRKNQKEPVWLMTGSDDGDYGTIPENFAYGEVLKSGEILIYVPAKDAWDCPTLYYLKKDGSLSPPTPLLCKTSDC